MECVATRLVHCVKIWASVIPRMVPVFAFPGSLELYVKKVSTSLLFYIIVTLLYLLAMLLSTAVT